MTRLFALLGFHHLPNDLKSNIYPMKAREIFIQKHQIVHSKLKKHSLCLLRMLFDLKIDPGNNYNSLVSKCTLADII